MNPLLSRLAGLRRKVRLLEGWQGVCALLALVGGAVVVAGLLDWAVQLPSFIRSVVLVSIVAGAGVVAYRYLLRPLHAPCDNLTLALRIEAEFPELNDALGSTVQFLTEPADSPGAASSSQAMRTKAVDVMMSRAQQYDFGRIISYRPALLLGIALIAVIAVAAHFAYRHGAFARIALYRLADPFGNHTWTTVDVPDAPKRIAVGQPFTIKATLTGRIPEHAKVEIRTKEETRPEQWDVRVQKESNSVQRESNSVPRESNTVQRESNSVFMPVDKIKHNKDFEFRVVANDGSFPPQPGRWHLVKVLPPPSLVDLDGQPSPQIEVFPPAYTEEPSPVKLPPGTKMIKAWAGSNVMFRAAIDRPVARVWFEHRPITTGAAPVPSLRGAALLGQLAMPGLSAVGALFGGQTLWERIPADLDASGKMFAVRFTAWHPGTCILHLEDEDRLPKEYMYELDVGIDPLPVVRLRQPATDLTLLPDAEVAFRFQAEDEIFGLRSLFIEYQRSTAGAPPSGTERALLELPEGYDKELPQLTAPIVVGRPNGPDSIRPKQRRIDVASLWKLNHHFKPGETIHLEVCADDYCDIYGSRPPGRSHQIKLLIVTKGELAKVIDEKLKGIQQDVGKIRKMQQEARDIVKEIENKDKITEKDVDRLQEAEQTQRQIQEQVGTPDDGLRKELDKLQQLLNDNKMKDSEAQLRTGMIKGALDQLARQELQQIQPALEKARKQLAAEANKQGKDTQPKKDPKNDPKNDPKTPAGKKDDPLANTAKLQDSALKNLDELAQALSPWASIQEVKDELRSIIDKQRDIKKELDEVKAKNEKPDSNKEDLRDQLGKDVSALEDLAKRTSDLQHKIDEVQKKRQQEGDKENAKRLKEAKNIAEAAALPSKMKEIIKDLKEAADPKSGKEPTPSNVTQQQNKKVGEALDKMLSALEGKDDIDKQRLQKNQLAQDKLDKLNKEMKELKQKLDEINKIKDNEERLQKRKELADKFDDLRAQAEEQARELARLQEPQASKKMDQAAEELAKGGKQAQDGQDPGEAQKQAQEKMKQAKQALEQSQEELAREQLAKIADRLQGLKERQDAAVERTKEFHRRLMAKKNYTDALGRTLEGDTKAQEGLAKETRSLKEKIKDAKVFEHIMERAAASMDEAVQAMKDRRTEGMVQRQKDLKVEKWDKKDVEEENEYNEQTLKHQTQAASRLKRLIDAVKEELAKKPPDKKDDAANNGEQPDGPKMRAADGIPAVAQLKALRSEQLDLNERTDEFAKRHPNTNNLMDAQRRELEQLETDQRNLQELFRQMTANAEKKGDAQ
jgi:hypothetical protein